MKQFAACLCLGLALVLCATTAWTEEAKLQRSVVTVPTDAAVQTTARVYPAGTRAALHPLETQKIKFTVAIYGWLSDVSGTSWTQGVGTDFDIGFDQITEHLNAGFMGYAEVRWGKWTFAVDSYVAELQGDLPIDSRLLDGKVVIDNVMVDLRLGYTVWQKKLGADSWRGCCLSRAAVLDAVIGARYWNQKITLGLDSPLLPGGGISPSTREEWVDPYLGARFRADFAKRWRFSLYGDVGGFGIGDASKLTWQVQTSIGFRLTPRFFLFLGYRAMYLDGTDGSDASKSGVTTTTHGPTIGAGYTF